MADEPGDPLRWFGLGGWIETATTKAGSEITLLHAGGVSNAMSFYRVLAQ